MKRIYQGFAVLGALIACAIVVATVIDVGGRNLGLGSLHGTIEAASLGMAFIVYCGVAYHEHQHGHISVSLVTEKLSARVKNAVFAFSSLVSIVIAAFLAWGTADEALKSYNSGERVVGISSLPVWPARLVVALGLLLLVAALIQATFRHRKGQAH